MTNQKKTTIQFRNLEVNMIYGYALEACPQFQTWFDAKSRKLRDSGRQKIRAGWTSFYKMNHGPGETLVFPLAGDFQERTLVVPPLWSTIEKDRSQGSCQPVVVRPSIMATVRRDGLGALTLTMNMNFRGNDPEDLYELRDLLAILLLAPRTLVGLENGEVGRSQRPKTNPELARFEPPLDCPNSQELAEWVPELDVLAKSWEQLSCCYRFFTTAMLGFIADIHRQKRPEGLDFQEEDTLQWREFAKDQIFNQEADTDPQIPYVYVIGNIPYEEYREAFLEENAYDYVKKREKRKQYTKDIAAVLGRWLVENNVPYASADYWERRNLLRDGVFLSTYMNSLVFTIFSGMATLSLQPDLQDPKMAQQYPDANVAAMKLPFSPTRNSILRCLEFSRMRWHHVLSVSYALDVLIQAVNAEKDVGRIHPYLEKLTDLRGAAAVHFEDPLAHFWDATVGTEIADFMHTSVIERLEECVTRKLDMVKQLLADRFDILRIRDYVQSLERVKKKGWFW